MPMSELGKPKADACSVVITEPHEMTGFRLQDGTYVGSISISIFSMVRASAAASPATPATRTYQAVAGRRVTSDPEQVR